MYVSKTIKLIGSNYATHLKCLLIQILAICLIVAIFGLFFINFGSLIYNVVEENGLVDKTQDLINDLVLWDEEAQTNFSENVLNYVNSIKTSINSIPNFDSKMIAAAWIFILASYFVYFLIGLAIYPTFFCINQFMSTNTTPYYLWAFVKKFVDSMKMMAIKSLLCILIDWCCVFLAVGAYVMVFSSWGIFGVIMAIVFWLVFYSIRNTLFAYWLPVSINKVSTRQAFKAGVVLMLDNFWRLLLKTFITSAIFFAIIAIIICFFTPIVITIFVLLLLGVENYILTCTYFVNFYEQTGKPYFVKKVKINANVED